MIIVQDAVHHTPQLQIRMKSFMESLEQIASIIDNTEETSEFVYDTAEDTDGVMEPTIKRANCSLYMTLIPILSKFLAGSAEQRLRHDDKAHIRLKSL